MKLVQNGQPDKYIEWKQVRKRVIEKREETGYSSESEEQKQAEMKGGKSGKKRERRARQKRARKERTQGKGEQIGNRG